MLPSILRICSEKSPATISLLGDYPAAAICVSFDSGSESAVRYLYLFDAETFGPDATDETLPSIPDIEIMVGRRTGRLYGISLNWRAGLFQLPALPWAGDEPAEETYCTPELDMDSAWPADSTAKICRANVPIRASWDAYGALLIQLGNDMEGQWIQPDRKVAIFVTSKGAFAGLKVVQQGLREAVKTALMP